VRSADEILTTLDERGRLDALPFMPEMLQYCGKRFQVFKSAHKTCDTLGSYKNRHMKDAVHLDGLRCDGAAHDGCQAGCLLFWKEEWLKRVDHPKVRDSLHREMPSRIRNVQHSCTLEALRRATRSGGDEGDERYRCQATDMLEATTPILWWDIRHYAKDIASRNVRLGEFIRTATMRTFIAIFRASIRLNWRGRRYPQYPMVRGLAVEKTPTEVLNLKEGDLVQVRSRNEIMHTINARQRNRGLWYDEEMLPYCDKQYRVLKKVERIIDERTGKLLHINGGCLILDGVVCSGHRSSNRLFCPRSIYPYWREIWLKRVESTNRSCK
jgi:hypothetical protein